jgi:hypothetical protein
MLFFVAPVVDAGIVEDADPVADEAAAGTLDGLREPQLFWRQAV